MSEGETIISIDIDGAIIPYFEVLESLKPMVDRIQAQPYIPYVPTPDENSITINTGVWAFRRTFACMLWRESMGRLFVYGVFREYPSLEPWQQAYAEFRGVNPILARYEWTKLIAPFAANPAMLEQWQAAFVAGAEWRGR